MRPTSAQQCAIEEVENELAILSGMDEAARILAMRSREPHNLSEIARIRRGIAQLKDGARARREQVRRDLSPDATGTGAD